MVLEADLDPADLAQPRARSCRAPRRSTPTTPTPSSSATACPSSSPTPPPSSAARVAGWNLADHRQHWADKRGSVGPTARAPRLRAAASSDGRARGQGRPARRRRVGAHHRPRPHRRRRLPLHPRPGRPGHHPGRVQGAARGRPGRARAPPRGAGRRRRRPRRPPPRRRARRRRRAAGDADTATADDLLAYAGTVLARYELPTEIRIVDQLPRTDSGKVDLAAVAALLRGGLSVDLRYSDADEAFRKEVRAWLDEAVPAYGPPPPPGDWDARRAYDTGWQRQLHDAGYAGLNWPVEYGGRGLPATQQLVYLEEYAASGAPYVGINFVGNAHAGPDAHRRGHRGAARASTCRGSSRARPCGARASPSPRPGSDLASLRTRAVARRRRLRRHRPEDLEHPGPRRRLLRAARAHRPRRPEAQGHHLADPRHAPARASRSGR